MSVPIVVAIGLVAAFEVARWGLRPAARRLRQLRRIARSGGR